MSLIWVSCWSLMWQCFHFVTAVRSVKSYFESRCHKTPNSQFYFLSIIIFFFFSELMAKPMLDYDIWLWKRSTVNLFYCLIKPSTVIYIYLFFIKKGIDILHQQFDFIPVPFCRLGLGRFKEYSPKNTILEYNKVY